MKIAKKILFLIVLSTSSLSAYSAIPQNNIFKENNREVGFIQQLREAIMADNKLSASAHNIEILTIKNSIVLKGRVASKAEKVQIENLARARAGHMKVYNRLTY